MAVWTQQAKVLFSVVSTISVDVLQLKHQWLPHPNRWDAAFVTLFFEDATLDDSLLDCRDGDHLLEGSIVVSREVLPTLVLHIDAVFQTPALEGREGLS